MNETLLYDASLTNKTETFHVNQPMVVAFVLSTVVACIANFLIIFCIGCLPKLRSNFNVYIASLAVADFIVGVAVFPFMIVDVTHAQWPLGKAICSTWYVVDFSCCTVSMLHLCLLAYDRFCAIVRPLSHLKQTKRQVACSLAVVWVVGVLIWALPIIYFRHLASREIDESSCIYEIYPSKEFILGQAIVCYYLPISVMIYFYGRVIYALRPTTARDPSRDPIRDRNHVVRFQANNRTLQNNNDSNENPIELTSVSFRVDTRDCDGCIKTQGHTLRRGKASNKGHLNYGLSMQISRQEQEVEMRRKNHKRCALNLGVIMGIFLVCWFPYCIVMPLMAYCPECVSDTLYDYSALSCYLNSSLNPVIYFALNRNFRRGLVKLCKFTSSENDSNSYSKRESDSP